MKKQTVKERRARGKPEPPDRIARIDWIDGTYRPSGDSKCPTNKGIEAGRKYVLITLPKGWKIDR